MPFAALDDGFHANKKVIRVGNEGAGLYARALSFCACETTDGYVPRAWAMQAVEGKKTLLSRLEKVGLWVSVKPGDHVEIEDRSDNKIEVEIEDAGYVILDYVQFNFSSVEVAERRKQRQDAGRKGATIRWQSDSEEHGGSYSKGYGGSHGEEHGGTHGKGDGKDHGKAMAQNPLPLPLNKQQGANAPTEEAVQDVYAHWRKERGKTNARYAKISDGRRKKIQGRLREFTPDDLKAAITAVALDPWPERHRHDDITVIFRSREQVDKFLGLSEISNTLGARNGRGLTPAEIVALTEAKP